MISVKFFGAEMKFSVGFFCVLSLMLYIDKTGMMLLTLKATLFHELGHIIAIYLLGFAIKQIELRVGAFLLCGNFDYSLNQELLVSLSGPLANIVLSAICYFLYKVLNFSTLTESLLMLVIGLFHMLPIIGLDGGTALKCVLLRFIKTKNVLIIQEIISLVLIFALILLGFAILLTTKNNPSLVLLGLYLLFCFFIGNDKKQLLKY